MISPQERCPSKQRTYIPKRVLGVSLTLLSSACSATMMLSIKFMPNIHAFEIVFFRMAIQVVISVPLLLFMKVDMNAVIKKTSNILLLVGRSFTNSTSIMFSYFAVTLIDIGEESAIVFASPIVVTFLAFVLLKERVTMLDCVIVIISVLGVFFIAQPKFVFGTAAALTKNRVLDLGSAVAGCFGCSLAIIAMRLMKGFHTMIVVFVMALWGMVQSGILCFIFNLWTIPKENASWMLLCAIGVIGFLGSFALTAALKFEKAGIVAAVMSSEVVLAYIYDVFVLHHLSSVWSFLGAGLILSGVIMTSIKTVLVLESKPTLDTEERKELLQMEKPVINNGTAY